MDSFLETLRQLGPARLAVMAAIVVALLGFFVFISLRISSPDMKLLFSDLSPTDSGAVAAKLEEVEIPYEISADGSRIVVPGKDVGRARMLLAQEGIPNGGSLGYEIFDKQTGFGTTNFVQNINQVRALEGELARTISSLENIRSVRVHIVLPQRELFSREQQQSSASVFLGIRPGANVERQQVSSIQSLVASAVPNLKATNVSVIDSNGNLLAKGGDEEADALTVKADELRRNFERQLVSKIEDQVGRIVGPGKVTAIVTADMNFDRISTNEELFDPNGQVLRSTQTTEEQDSETEESSSKDVSVGNNLPGANGDLLSDSGPSSSSNKTEEVNNYEISKTVRSTIREVGEINKLSVSVLVDGRYTQDKDGKEVYEPRNQQELDQITALVRSAVGLDDDRGDTLQVSNLQFAEIETGEELVDDRYMFGFEKTDLLDAGKSLLIVIMMILVILLVIQPMVSRLLATEPSSGNDKKRIEPDMLAAAQNNPALAAPTESSGGSESGGYSSADDALVDIQGVEGKVKASTLKKVEEIVENYPSETVSVIRSWMTQEN